MSPEDQIIFSTMGLSDDEVIEDEFEEVSIDGTSSNIFEESIPLENEPKLPLKDVLENCIESTQEDELASNSSAKEVKHVRLKKEYECAQCNFTCKGKSRMFKHIDFEHSNAHDSESKRVTAKQKSGRVVGFLREPKNKIDIKNNEKTNFTYSVDEIPEIMQKPKRSIEEMVRIEEKKSKYRSETEEPVMFGGKASLTNFEKKVLGKSHSFRKEDLKIIKKSKNSKVDDDIINSESNEFPTTEDEFEPKAIEIPKVVPKPAKLQRKINLTDTEKKILGYREKLEEEFIISSFEKKTFKPKLKQDLSMPTMFNKKMFGYDDKMNENVLFGNSDTNESRIQSSMNQPPIENENDIIITDPTGRKRIIKVREHIEFKQEILIDSEERFFERSRKKLPILIQTPPLAPDPFKLKEELILPDIEETKVLERSYQLEAGVIVTDSEGKKQTILIKESNDKELDFENIRIKDDVQTESEDAMMYNDNLHYDLVEGDLEMAHHMESSSSNSNPYPIERTSAFTCPYCSYESDRRSEMHTHVKTVHREKWDKTLEMQETDNLLYCMYCTFVTDTRQSLSAHTRRLHPGSVQPQKSRKLPPKLYKCDHCKFSTEIRRKYQVHVERNHIYEAKFSCEYCGKKFKVKTDLSNHIKFQHNAGTMVCEICGKVCNNPNTLHLHQKREHFKPEFQCKVCYRRMVSKANLEEHIKKQHIEKSNFMCEQCGKVFDLWSKLKNHYRTHTGERPHKCHLCSRSFARRAVYRQHLLLHTGQRPYICDICGKAFAQKPGLICHRKNHPGEKPPLPVVYIDHILDKYVKKEEIEENEESTDDTHYFR